MAERLLETRSVAVPRTPGGFAAQAEVPIVPGTDTSELGETLARYFYGVAQNMETQLGERAGAEAGQRDDYRPSIDPTARGKAFNAAAQRVYLSRTVTAARQQLREVYRKHRDDPGALAEAVKGLRAGYEANLFPEIRQDFIADFERMSGAFIEDARDRGEAAQAEADKAALVGLLEERGDAVERLAYSVKDDAEFATKVSAEIVSMRNELVRYGPRAGYVLDGEEVAADPNRAGVLSLADVTKQITALKDRATVARTVGAFKRLPGLGAKEKWLRGWEANYETSGLSLEQHQQITRLLRSEVNHLQSEESAAIARANRADVLADKAIRRQQEEGAAALFEKTLTGEASEADVLALARARMITPEAGRTAIEFMRNRAAGPPARDNPTVAYDLTMRIEAKDPTVIEDIGRAAAAGELTPGTMRSLLGDVKQAQNDEGIFARPDVKQAIRDIEDVIGVPSSAGAMASLNPQSAQELAQKAVGARDMLRRRILENPSADVGRLRDEVIAVYQGRAVNAAALPRSRYVTTPRPTRADLEGAYQKLQDDAAAGRISRDAFKSEGEALLMHVQALEAGAAVRNERAR